MTRAWWSDTFGTRLFWFLHLLWFRYHLSSFLEREKKGWDYDLILLIPFKRYATVFDEFRIKSLEKLLEIFSFEQDFYNPLTT